MAKPTRTECLDGARDILTDTSVAGGDLYDDTILAKSYDTAFRDLVRALEVYLVPELERVKYFKLPALAHRVELADEGITLLSDPLRVREAPISALYEVSNVTNTKPVEITVSSTPSAISTQDPIYVFGVKGQTAINGKWFVSGIAGNVLTVAEGDTSSAYSSGGSVVKLSSDFTEMYPVARLDLETLTVSNREYVWRDESLIMNPTIGASGRLIEVTYFERVDPPQSGELPFDDCLDFIKHKIAFYQMAALGVRQATAEQKEIAAEKLAAFLRNYRIRRTRELK